MGNQVAGAKISFRILERYLDREGFASLLDLFDAYPGVTDEITFFTAETHAPLTLERTRAKAAVLKARMQEARARGYRAGINLLATIGHHDEHLAHSLSEPYTRLTDPYGEVCRGAYCPNDPDMQRHIRTTYEILAAAEPDYIWIDDDIRLCGHMPIGYTCFCDACLAMFNEKNGFTFTRETLRQAFDGELPESRLAIRKLWLRHNCDSIAALLERIRATVAAGCPGLPIGFMTGERFYEGYGFAEWERALSGGGAHEVIWRPGGGFYTDDRPAGMAGKAHEIGRQISLLPERVTNVQSEIENFPYQRLRKSVRATALEAACHIAAGCTGAAFNVLSPYPEPLAEYEPFFAELRRFRPFYDLLAAKLVRSACLGVGLYWSTLSFAGERMTGEWLTDGGVCRSLVAAGTELHEIGLPPAYGPGRASVLLLPGDAVPAMSDAEIREALATGVYMDADALAQLNARGFGQWTGFAIAGSMAADTLELLDADESAFPELAPLNGRLRDCRQSFRSALTGAFGNATILAPVGAGARRLSRYVNYAGEAVGDCALGVYANEWGGRVAVGGYFPWTLLQNEAKAQQMKRLLRWLSQERLPAYIASYHKCNLWVRETDGSGPALVLLNGSLDAASDVRLAIATEADRIRLTDMACHAVELVCECRDGSGYGYWKLPPLGAWEMRLIEMC